MISWGSSTTHARPSIKLWHFILCWCCRDRGCHHDASNHAHNESQFANKPCCPKNSFGKTLNGSALLLLLVPGWLRPIPLVIGRISRPYLVWSDDRTKLPLGWLASASEQGRGLVCRMGDSSSSLSTMEALRSRPLLSRSLVRSSLCTCWSVDGWMTVPTQHLVNRVLGSADSVAGLRGWFFPPYDGDAALIPIMVLQNSGAQSHDVNH